ncbi:hypothetical protein L1987_48725 [Smallanthus sonchifolius]|uniref:Uncharacterized protein n=1 Tax=Smallanthus sonchifolius TaxID=185202 RepID=A0ACB9FST2_9ASTR|nr:hypothetical protein L1987_48725 [Smallanthus sonchifolius]
MKEYSTPFPQRQISTSPSSRKKSQSKKSRKARIISSTHIGRRFVIKRANKNIETYKCISDVMELPDSDLQKITGLRIDRFNENESSKMLIKVLKQRGFIVYEENKVQEEPLEIVHIVTWELLSKTEQFIITYHNDNWMVCNILRAQRKMRMRKRKRHLLGMSNILTAVMMRKSLLTLKFHLLNLMGQSHNGSDSQYGLSEGKKKVVPISTYVPIVYWEYVDGNYELKRGTGAMENYNSIELLCINEK